MRIMSMAKENICMQLQMNKLLTKRSKKKEAKINSSASLIMVQKQRIPNHSPLMMRTIKYMKLRSQQVVLFQNPFPFIKKALEI